MGVMYVALYVLFYLLPKTVSFPSLQLLREKGRKGKDTVFSGQGLIAWARRILLAASFFAAEVFVHIFGREGHDAART